MRKHFLILKTTVNLAGSITIALAIISLTLAITAGIATIWAWVFGTLIDVIAKVALASFATFVGSVVLIALLAVIQPE